MSKKVYVKVDATFDTEGGITPKAIIWNDETVYQIDKILNICRAASMKGGGAGIRYTCSIKNTLTYLFLENSKWFVEAKD